ncbi:hypothetical protein NC651_002383 [Populus alba x Populus x berolinensis]|nr:hypothetical protein NC651_002383 [Populus alba x Populus x berolinensis]
MCLAYHENYFDHKSYFKVNAISDPPIPAATGKLEKLQTVDHSNHTFCGEAPSPLGYRFHALDGSDIKQLEEQMKQRKTGFKETQERTHKITVTLSFKSVENLRKVSSLNHIFTCLKAEALSGNGSLLYARRSKSMAIWKCSLLSLMICFQGLVCAFLYICHFIILKKYLLFSFFIAISTSNFSFEIRQYLKKKN